MPARRRAPRAAGSPISDFLYRAFCGISRLETLPQNVKLLLREPLAEALQPGRPGTGVTVYFGEKPVTKIQGTSPAFSVSGSQFPPRETLTSSSSCSMTFDDECDRIERWGVPARDGTTPGSKQWLKNKSHFLFGPRQPEKLPHPSYPARLPRL